MTTPDSLEKLLARGVDNALLRFGLGKAYLDSGKPEQAAEHLQKCLGFDPNYSAAWKLLGQACQRLGMLEEARQAWHNGLEVARKRGDKQTEKEMTVFLRRLVLEGQGHAAGLEAHQPHQHYRRLDRQALHLTADQLADLQQLLRIIDDHEHTALGDVAGGHQHLAVRGMIDAQLDLQRGALVLALVVHACPVSWGESCSDGNSYRARHQYHFFSPSGRFLKRFMLHRYWLG